MNTIVADCLPEISITRLISPEPEFPSIQRMTVFMSANDYAIDNEEIANESFARVSLILFDPNKGNPTDDADNDSQELLDVSSAFYDPEGDLSLRSIEKGADSDYTTPPLIYIDRIDLLEGYEKGGRLEAGLILALKQVSEDLGCDFHESPLMVSAFEQRTLHIVHGVNLHSSKATAVNLSDNFKDTLRLGSWVDDGAMYATEPGHGAAQGMILPDAVKQVMGHECRLDGNRLLGCAGFNPDVKLSQRPRSDKKTEAWAQTRYKAHGYDTEGHLLPTPAVSLASLADQLQAQTKQRLNGVAPTRDDVASFRAAIGAILTLLPQDFQPLDPDLGSKVKTKRAAASRPRPGPPSLNS